MTPGQREPTLLRGRSTLRPAERVEHILIATGDAGKIYGHIPASGVQDHAELSLESLDGVVIEVTPQDQAGVLGTAPHDDDRLLGYVFHHVAPISTHWSAVPPGSGAACRTGAQGPSSSDRHTSIKSWQPTAPDAGKHAEDTPHRGPGTSRLRPPSSAATPPADLLQLSVMPVTEAATDGGGEERPQHDRLAYGQDRAVLPGLTGHTMVRGPPPTAGWASDLVKHGSGGRFRTYDLWVMSPASYRAAPPRDAGHNFTRPAP